MAETGGAHPRRHLFHIPLQAAVGALCVYWYWHIPAPSKAVLWLGGVAALMTLVEMRPLHKAIYFALVIALIFTENRAIDKDRHDFAYQEGKRRSAENQQFNGIGTSITTNVQRLLDNSDKQFRETTQQASRQFDVTMSRSEKIMGGLKETVNAATGGNSFCYALLVPPDYAGNAAAISSIIPRGKYPLTNVNALVTDDDMMTEYLNKVSNTGTTHSADDFASIMQRAQEWLHIGDLPPNFPEQFSMRAATVTGDRRMLTIFFWANNGNWIEKFALRRVNGKWLRLIRVWKERLDKKKKAMVADVIFEQVDDGFPEDMNTKESSGLSTSPSH